jgi:hypothetical protein
MGTDQQSERARAAGPRGVHVDHGGRRDLGVYRQPAVWNQGDLRDHAPQLQRSARWAAHQLFLYTRIIPVVIVIGFFYAVAALGEKFERKSWVLWSGLVFTVISSLLLLTQSSGALILVALASPGFVYLWLFTMYNYTSAAYPTRLRSVGTGWTDGVGHRGALIGTSILVGRLFEWTLADGAWAWILYCAIPGALIPSIMLYLWGSKQKGRTLEELAP